MDDRGADRRADLIVETGTKWYQMAKAKVQCLARGITEIELKVQEATNNDKWGPHGSAMQEIARAAESHENMRLILGVIWDRFKDRYLDWRPCYKALLLSEFLIRRGPMSIVDEMRREMGLFKQLQSFMFTDTDGREQGINVRQRAGEVVALLNNPGRITQERQKARETADKYRGVSSDDMLRGSNSSSAAYGSSGSAYHGSSSAGYGGGGLPSASTSGRGQGWGGSAASAGAGYNSLGAGGEEGGLRGGEEEEDPFEATRRRIEHLRASGAQGQEARASGHGWGGPVARQPSAAGAGGSEGAPLQGSINMDASTNLFPEHVKGGPRRLSEVKVNPAIAAAFGSLSLKPGASGRPAAGAATTGGSAGGAGSGIDLLDDLVPPAPAAPVAPAAPAAPAPAPQGHMLLDGLLFDTAPAPAPVPAAPATAGPPAPPEDDEWGSLVGVAATGGGGGGSSCAVSQAPLGSVVGWGIGGPDPFALVGAGTAPAVAGGAGGPGAGLGMSSGGLPPPKSNDPFADLKLLF